jgi:hypothetical protein
MENFKIFKEKILERFQEIQGSLKKLGERGSVKLKNFSVSQKIAASFNDLKINLILFQEEIQRRLLGNWTEFTQKVTDLGKFAEQRVSEVSQRFDELKEKFQPEFAGYTELKDGLVTKDLIEGEMTFQDVDLFAKTLWENHDLAHEAFEQTNDPQYYEMAMDILMVIQEMEQLKDYLMKHGKI